MASQLQLHSTLNQPLFGLICFTVTGEGIGQCVTCVSAGSIDTARARLEPLYRGCQLTPLHQAPSAGS